jgi:hypothetical protein
LIQDLAPMRNLDSRNGWSRCDCCRILFHRTFAATFATQSQDEVEKPVELLVRTERLLAGHWADPSSLSPREITLLCRIEDLLDQLEEKTNYG